MRRAAPQQIVPSAVPGCPSIAVDFPPLPISDKMELILRWGGQTIAALSAFRIPVWAERSDLLIGGATAPFGRQAGIRPPQLP
jgi:hypothetical protein